MDFKIEKGIPMPGQRGSQGDTVMQTLRNMEVGDSFLLPNKKRPSIHSQAKRAGIKVSVRTVNESDARVWRVA